MVHPGRETCPLRCWWTKEGRVKTLPYCYISLRLLNYQLSTIHYPLEKSEGLQFPRFYGMLVETKGGGFLRGNGVFGGLTGNQLKLIALVAMTLDHIGLVLLPRVTVLRVLGRLAFPIYGWMVAESCRHTSRPRRYVARLAELAALCQIVYFGAMGSLYQCVVVSFTLSAILCFACRRFQREGSAITALAVFGLLALVVFVTQAGPRLLSGTDFDIDYGLWGILLPLLVFLGRDRREQLGLLTLALVGLGLDYGGLQWWALAAVPLLALYNGQRGRHALGRLFYIYYPTHLVAIYAVGLLMRM